MRVGDGKGTPPACESFAKIILFQKLLLTLQREMVAALNVKWGG